MIWGERERLAAIVRTVADDPAIDQLLLFYDEPRGTRPAASRTSWDAVRDGLRRRRHRRGRAGARRLDAARAAAGRVRGRPTSSATSPAVAGLRTGVACAAALQRPLGSPERLRAIAAAAAAASAARRRAPARRRRRARGSPRRTRRRCCAARGIAVPAGEVVAAADDAVRAAAALGVPVAIKATLRVAAAQERGGRARPRRVRRGRGPRRVRSRSRPSAAPARPCSSRRWRTRRRGASSPRAATPSSRRSSSASAASGRSCSTTWPSSPCRPRRRGSRRPSTRCAAPACSPAPAAATPVDLAALAALAAAAGDLLLSERLTLLELNPVIATATGAVAVDAVARRGTKLLRVVAPRAAPRRRARQCVRRFVADDVGERLAADEAAELLDRELDRAIVRLRESPAWCGVIARASFQSG